MPQLPKSDPKIALVLAGGGIAGAVYELGALRAIDDLLIDRTVNDLDIYVGTSAGALVASGLINGLTPQKMLQSVEGVYPNLPSIRRSDLFDVDVTALLKRTGRMPASLAKSAMHYSRNPSDLNIIDLFWELSRLLPSAIYNGSSLGDYVDRLVTQSGISNRFVDLPAELYIIAHSLETGQRVVFGEEGYEDVLVSDAVTASTAVPGLYKPVRIGDDEFLDGGLGGNASIDVAIEHGADLVVCINPIVPFDNSTRKWKKKGRYLSEDGMQTVINQVYRIMTHSGLQYHIKQLKRHYPDVDIILIEPRPDDQDMMFANVMRYSSRLKIAQHGYESVTVDLAADYFKLKDTLEKYGVIIDRRSRVVPQLEKVLEPGATEEVVEEMLDFTPSHRKKPAGLSALREMISDLEISLPLK